MKVFWAFCKQQFYTITAYRTSFWMSIANIIIKLYASVMLWLVLYNQNSKMFDVSLQQILTYSVASIALSQTFTWWDGPHTYVEAYVKNGKIIIDLFRPIDFELLLLYRGSSESFVNFIIYTVPTFLLAIIVLKIKLTIDYISLLLFIMSILGGYLILFLLNFMFALLSFITIDLRGYLHVHHGIIAFASGQVVPLWLYPKSIRSIIELLPFKGIFSTPLNIIIGNMYYTEAINALIFQFMWIAILFILGRIMWNKTLKKIVIQGG